jgi:hypothetical protein
LIIDVGIHGNGTQVEDVFNFLAPRIVGAQSAVKLHRSVAQIILGQTNGETTFFFVVRFLTFVIFSAYLKKIKILILKQLKIISQ